MSSKLQMYLGLDRAHFLSPTGQCKPFDIAADGYCRAEASTVFMLKRMKDAIIAGDRVYGVIKGTHVNQSGTSKSITHPDADTQAQLFQSLLKRARAPARSLSVVEAHGTGMSNMASMERSKSLMRSQEPRQVTSAKLLACSKSLVKIRVESINSSLVRSRATWVTRRQHLVRLA